MTGPSPFKYSRALLSFMAVLLIFLGIANVVTVSHQRKQILDEVYRHARAELNLMGTLVREALLKHDYAMVEQFLTQWGEEHANVIEIKAIAPNNFVLARYNKGTAPAEHIFHIQQRIQYAGKDLITLEIVKDFTSVERNLNKLHLLLLASSVFLTIIVGITLWYTLRRTALIPMEREITKRRQAEEALQKVRDELEIRVEERTGELKNANEQMLLEITERKQAEKEQTRLQRRLEALWKIARMVDADHKTLCDCIMVEIIAITQSRYAFYGFLNEDETVLTIYSFSMEVMGKCWVQDKPIEFPVVNAGLWGDAVRERRILIINDYQADHPSKKGFPEGHVLLTRILVVPIFSRNRIVALAGVANKASDYREEDARQIDAFATNVQVILERKQAEEEKEKIYAQLLHAQKMEAIGTLAGGVAHDFNNLLTAIQGYTELSLIRVDKTSPLHGNLKHIHRASLRAASLTRQLLFLSRRQPMELTLLNINRTVDDLLKMLNRLIGEDIAINTNMETALWTVRADEGNIEQVIMNLVVNARDAMFHGGKLTIKTENVTLDEGSCKGIPEARPGKFVCLSVMDTGAGMDKEIIQHIFEPFFTTKEAGKGTGLGLSVVYGIIKQHEGWINVYSEDGQGSTFKVYLPASSIKLKDTTVETIPIQELQGSSERILLLEDEEGVRGFVTKTFRENGYVVFEAASAKKALDIFERENGRFHLVFSDIVLPDKSGLQLIDQLLSRKPGLPVLLSTSYTDAKSQWPVIRERGFKFLQKPYVLLDLLKTVREAIEQG